MVRGLEEFPCLSTFSRQETFVFPLLTLCRGTLVKDRKTGKERLTCRNWECGVVFPVSRIKAAADDGAGHVLTSDTGNTSDVAQAVTTAFAGLPLPVRFPAEKYAESGPGSHPWFVFG